MNGFQEFRTEHSFELKPCSLQVEKVHQTYWHACLVDHDVESGDIFKVTHAVESEETPCVGLKVEGLGTLNMSSISKRKSEMGVKTFVLKMA